MKWLSWLKNFLYYLSLDKVDREIYRMGRATEEPKKPDIQDTEM